MNNCIGIIKSNHSSSNKYNGLTNARPDYMLPFGGRYRAIDFTLSNFSQYGLSKVLVFAGANIRSTLDHVGNGKNWGMDKRYDGLLINPPNYGQIGREDTEIYSYYNALKFFDDAKQENVYICNPMVIARIDIKRAYKEFVDNDYDVMFLYKKQDDREGEFFKTRKIIFDRNNNPINIGMHLGTEHTFNMYVENMFIKKDVFKKIVKEALEEGSSDNLVQAISNNKEKLNIGVLEISRHVEYIRDTISFYRANMNLLDQDIYYDLLLAGEGIRTKSKDEPSTLYLDGNNTFNSLVANGCIIEGEVENSILFRGVKIGKNAIVKNSVIFQKAEIEDNAVIINSIIDKNTVIKEGVFVQGALNNPYVVEKNMVIEK